MLEFSSTSDLSNLRRISVKTTDLSRRPQTGCQQTSSRKSKNELGKYHKRPSEYYGTDRHWRWTASIKL